jgi:ubiquinone/menaquinone biosynthesis C-methylase UbiE
MKKKLTIQEVFGLALQNHKNNNFKVAANLYMEVLEVKPNHIDAVNKLTALLGNAKLDLLMQIDRAIVKKLLLFLFRRNDIDHKDIFLITRFLLFKEENHNYDQIKKIVISDSLLLESQIIKNLINEELFQLMLQKSLITDVFLEKILIKIRYEILFALVNKNQKILSNHFNFIFSLAEQCFFNEYIYFQQPKETDYILQLKNLIINKEKINEMEIIVLSCYVPLYSLKNIISKLSNYKSENILFNNLVNMQIKEPLREKKLVNSIKSFREISDAVSKKVRDQYEKHPYPRWRYFYGSTPTNFLTIINALVRPNKIAINNKFDNPNILIAGCGTGKQILVANNYLNANILAVDLSLASLAYAKRKIEKLNLKNIEFLHADILQLKNLNKKFDVIECAGVLHHMRDPLEGLNVLLELLEPHGLLRLGLYSELARQDIIEVREFIKNKKFMNTINDIRKCRKAIIENKENRLLKKVLYRKDFYSTSAARDLMFHIQEHRFTLKQISKISKNFNLEFLGFVGQSLKNKFSIIFPNDKNNVSLDNWDQFEKNNPDTFIGMYDFLVRKIK